ncbi:MAG: hypothetical protein QOJ92_2907 [Frankiales bacterium]|jgi:hypothetical protein|nr:hypothetical protein [Frankiales bacterium]MDX6275697.1 hypothetical protein [Frankiales bacterium]
MSRWISARTARRALIVLGVLLVVCVLWALRSALAARSDLQAVRADLTALREHPPAERASLTPRLVKDRDKARRASSLLGQPGPRLIAGVPLLGRSLDAERAVADAAAAAVEAAIDIDAATRSLGTAGRVDVTALAKAATTLQARADKLAGPMARLRAAPTSRMPGFVSRSVREAQDQLGGVDGQLTRAAAAARALSGVLGGSGDRRLLVVLENNAELRGTGGLVSTFAVGTTHAGVLRLQPFRDVREVAAEVDKAKVLPSPADYAAHYGPYRANTTIWRNITMSPDVPTAAAVLAEAAAATTGVRPDVVMLLDVPGIAGIVDATEPIVLDGKKLTGDELIRSLLVEAYVGTDNSIPAQNERRKREEQAADAALRDLTNAAASLSFAKALADATAGRHLALWSARPAEQKDLELARAAGSVDPGGADLALVAANNLGDSPGVGNKLDYYISRRVKVSVVVGHDSARVTQTLTMANQSPTGLAPYVEGVKRPGRVLELVQLAAAADARIVSFESGGVGAVADQWREDGSRRLAFVIDLGRTQVGSWTLTYDVPLVNGRYRMLLLPQALARPASLDVTVTTSPGVSVHTSGPRGHLDEWDSSLELTVSVDKPGLLKRVRDRLSRFWNEPVSF